MYYISFAEIIYIFFMNNQYYKINKIFKIFKFIFIKSNKLKLYIVVIN